MSRDGNREKHRPVHDMHQDAEETEVTKKFDVVRLKIFNFHKIRLVIITKLNTNNKYKIDTGSDGSLMLFSV